MLTKQSKASLRNTLREHDTSRLKMAAIGGEPSQGFENSFATLAYAYLQDKAPGLLDHMVGFQLVDRNNDNTKAVGIFGFQIGDQWAYAPVFFLNGDLKGHELLYLKNQDSFVPLKENWVNYLISRKPGVLGKGTPENLQALGVLQPDFREMSIPPDGKTACEHPSLKPWAAEILPRLAQWAVTTPSKMDKFAGLDERLDLRSFLASDINLVKAAREMGSRYPRIKRALAGFYGNSLLRDSLDALKDRVKKSASAVLQSPAKQSSTPGNVLHKLAAATTFPKLTVITDDLITKNRPEMTDAERKKMLRDGYLVRDYRTGEEISQAYNVQQPLSLSNPTETGVYDVLLSVGDYASCLVIQNPHTSIGRGRSLCVIKNSDKSSWDVVDASDLYVKQTDTEVKGREPFKQWWESLKDVGKKLVKDTTYVVVTKHGDGTLPFCVRTVNGDDSYTVDWEKLYSAGVSTSRYDGGVTDHSIRFNSREGSDFRAINGQLLIPPDVKVIKVADPPKCEKCNKTKRDCGCDYFRYPLHKSSPLKPGNLADLQMQLEQKTAELKIWHDQNDVVIGRRRMSKKAGLLHLIADHGLREKSAKRMMRESARFNGKRFRIVYGDGILKQAQAYPTLMGPGSIDFPEPAYGADPMAMYSQVPAQAPLTSYQTIPEMSAANTDRSIYDPTIEPDQNSAQVAQQASQSGQKEVFDTAMIGAMLKAVRKDSLVDRYLGDLMKALDRLGRIMFMMYWHGDEFTDRYGKQDMPELEDTLRNAFEVLGDLVLFLREKTIEPAGIGVGTSEPDIGAASRS